MFHPAIERMMNATIKETPPPVSTKETRKASENRRGMEDVIQTLKDSGLRAGFIDSSTPKQNYNLALDGKNAEISFTSKEPTLIHLRYQDGSGAFWIRSKELENSNYEVTVSRSGSTDKVVIETPDKPALTKAEGGFSNYRLEIDGQSISEIVEELNSPSIGNKKAPKQNDNRRGMENVTETLLNSGLKPEQRNSDPPKLNYNITLEGKEAVISFSDKESSRIFLTYKDGTGGFWIKSKQLENGNYEVTIYKYSQNEKIVIETPEKPDLIKADDESSDFRLEIGGRSFNDIVEEIVPPTLPRTGEYAPRKPDRFDDNGLLDAVIALVKEGSPLGGVGKSVMTFRIELDGETFDLSINRDSIPQIGFHNKDTDERHLITSEVMVNGDYRITIRNTETDRFKTITTSEKPSLKRTNEGHNTFELEIDGRSLKEHIDELENRGG